MKPEYAIIIPVKNEAECLGEVLSELKKVLGDQLGSRVTIAVGLNGCTDRSRQIAAEHGVLVGESKEEGYGHGCLAAMAACPDVSAYLFFAGDGANDPADIERLIELYESCGCPFVMGLRDFELQTWWEEFGRALPNLLLGAACAALGGQFFHDLGPLRLIDRDLLEKIAPRELTWGWTVEAQMAAARLGISIATVSVVERPRIAGQQKVSGVSLWRSASIGWKIFLAAWRTRFRSISD